MGAKILCRNHWISLRNNLIKKGKKSIASNLMKNLFVDLRNKDGGSVFSMLDSCLLNIQPSISVKTKKVSGTRYKIPLPMIRSDSSYSAKILISVSRKSKFRDTFSSEVFNSYKGVGACMKKKQELHKIALLNRSNLKFL